MNQEQLWVIFTEKNPKFLTDGGNFTAAGLKKFYDQVWEQAHKQGFNNGKAYAAMHPKKDYTDILGSLFKK